MRRHSGTPNETGANGPGSRALSRRQVPLVVDNAAQVAGLLRDGRLWNRRPKAPPFDMMPLSEAGAARKFYEFTLLWPAFSDDAYHRRIRAALVNGLAGTVNPLARQSFTQEAQLLLESRRSKTTDWAGEVARPYSVRVLSLVLGIEAADAEELARLGSVVLEPIGNLPADGCRLRVASCAADELGRWLENLTNPPGSRLVTVLDRIRRDPSLGPAVATAMFAQVVTGSVDPLVGALCVLAERVRHENMRLLTNTVLREEVFRLATPFRYAARYARCPLEIDGRSIAVGERVVLHLAAANMDPLAVPDPTDLKDRHLFRHLAFGLGAHYCLGAGIARAALDAVLTAMRSQAVVFHPDTVELATGEAVLRYRALGGVLR